MEPPDGLFVQLVFTVIAMSHRKAYAAWGLIITLVLSLGGATRTHDWCARRYRVTMLLSVQAGVIKPIN